MNSDMNPESCCCPNDEANDGDGIRLGLELVVWILILGGVFFLWSFLEAQNPVESIEK